MFWLKLLSIMRLVPIEHEYMSIICLELSFSSDAIRFILQGSVCFLGS